MIHIGEHMNIVNLLGSCTKGKESELWVLMEFCPHGNLLDFLRNRRDIFDPKWTVISKDPNSQWTIIDLVNSAYQVARGMEFLSSRRVSICSSLDGHHLISNRYIIVSMHSLHSSSDILSYLRAINAGYN